MPDLPKKRPGGGIFNFSDRPFHGSLGAVTPDRPVVAVAALPG